MKNSFSFYIKAFAISFGFFSLLTSCKENSLVQPDLIPDVDNINTFQLGANELPITFKVHQSDSLWTGDPSNTVVTVGAIDDDPFFGKVENQTYFQVTIPSVGYNYPTGFSGIDSAFVVLPYIQVAYGDTSLATKFELFEISDPSFKVDTSSKKYYDFSTVSTHSLPIGSYEGRPKDLQKDTLRYITKDSFVNQMQFKLSNTFVNKLRDLDSTKTKNNETFTSFLNGFCVKVDGNATISEKKALYYFDLNPSNASKSIAKARMVVHYRVDDTVNKVVVFPFDKKYSAFYSKIQRMTSGYPVANYTDGTPTDSLIIAGNPGYNTDVTISNLDNIPDAIINIARFTIKVPKSQNAGLEAPPLLLLNQIDENGVAKPVADYQIVNLAGQNSSQVLALAQRFVGGIPEEKTIDGVDYWLYELNIPRAVQKAILDKQNSLTLRVFSYLTYPSAYRMLVKANPITSDANLDFKIIYTKK